MPGDEIHWGAVLRMVQAGMVCFACIIFLHYYVGIPAEAQIHPGPHGHPVNAHPA